jgi:hypothetical protein
MKKLKKQRVATPSGTPSNGFAHSAKTSSSIPLRGLFGSGYTITEDVLM